MMYLCVCVGGELGKDEERDFSSFRKLVFPRKLTRIRMEPINVELSTENLSGNSRQWKIPIFPNSKKTHWKEGYVQKQGERLFFNKLVSWQLKICVKCAQNVFCKCFQDRFFLRLFFIGSGQSLRGAFMILQCFDCFVILKITTLIYYVK